jgi:prenyltransferase beta subunit
MCAPPPPPPPRCVRVYGQLGHCAPTYSAALSLLILGTSHPEAYDALPRASLYGFFMRMKRPSGGFCMHDGGETDVRGTYTVLAIASLLNILTPELTAGVVEFVLRCGRVTVNVDVRVRVHAPVRAAAVAACVLVWSPLCTHPMFVVCVCLLWVQLSNLRGWVCGCALV